MDVYGSIEVEKNSPNRRLRFQVDSEQVAQHGIKTIPSFSTKNPGDFFVRLSLLYQERSDEPAACINTQVKKWQDCFRGRKPMHFGLPKIAFLKECGKSPKNPYFFLQLEFCESTSNAVHLVAESSKFSIVSKIKVTKRMKIELLPMEPEQTAVHLKDEDDVIWLSDGKKTVAISAADISDISDLKIHVRNHHKFPHLAEVENDNISFWLGKSELVEIEGIFDEISTTRDNPITIVVEKQ